MTPDLGIIERANGTRTPQGCSNRQGNKKGVLLDTLT